MAHSGWLWIGFNVFVLAMLALDLGVFHRKVHEIRFKEAAIWSAVWIGLAGLFNIGIYVWFGRQPALEFLTGYVIEKSLSVDNIFIFLTIFSSFQVPLKYQHKILFWGILGALVMRAAFIFLGIELIQKFHSVIYIFGAFLIFTGIKMIVDHDKPKDFEKSWIIKWLRKVVPITNAHQGGRFFVRENGKRIATSLFFVLLLVEVTDLIFALDSIPAILAITADPFIVYTSNVFAILGLRSLYFALAGFVKYFVYLHYGLAAILVFVGTKMLMADLYKIPVGMALLVIGIFLGISILASILWGKRELPLGEDKEG